MRIEGLLAEQSAILDNVMFGVMFVRERRVVSANRRCEELFGYTNGQLTGGSTAMVFPSDAEFEAAGQASTGAGAGKYVTEERQYRRRDGSLFWCLVSGYALDPLRPTRAASGCTPTSPSASWPRKSCACRPPCSNTSPTA
jgi:PAS domain S-box-containing protein